MPDEWRGGVIQNQTDRAGLAYKRNRYYDPSTGRFTQVDPIGLGGGTNVYGFASGGPVNYGDPFGLCPATGPRAVVCQTIEAATTFVGSVIGFIGGGGGGALLAFATGGVTAPAVPSLAFAGAAGGAAIGLGAGISITNVLFAEDGGAASSGGAQDKRLSKGEIDRLKAGGEDVHALKGGKNALILSHWGLSAAGK